MQGKPVILVLCVFSVSADIGTTVGTTVPTTPDVDAKWLEDFRRALLRGSYDYGPAAAAPSSTTSSAKSKQNASEDAVASRELGISRRDLRGPKPGDSFNDAELDGPDAPRRAFLDSLYELEDQLKPVYVQSKPNSIDPLKESRKRWNEQISEEKISQYIEENGIKRYKVHMDPKERFRNKFVGVIPRLAEEWDIRKPQKETHVGASEGKYKQHNNERIEDMYRYVDKIPYDQGKYENQRNDRLSRNEEENRPIKYGDVLDGTQFRPKSVQGVNIEQSQQYSSSSSDESASSETQERDVSEYKQESLRSRYVEDGRRNAGAGYGERFAARRDKELLADRMASSTTPCRCRSEHSPVL